MSATNHPKAAGTTDDTPFSWERHRPREVPVEGENPSLPGEIAALLNRHAKHISELALIRATEQNRQAKSHARIMQLVFHLAQALADKEEQLTAAGGAKAYQRLHIIKDQLNDHLEKQGFVCVDPTGREFTDEMSDMVDVDGWRYATEYDHEEVIQTREPVILRAGEPVLLGAVVVGAPEE